MKRLISLAIVTIATTLLFVNPASAHVLKTDGTIGAVLHIQPDDSPVTGVTTTYQLSFTDTVHKLTNLADCDCRVTITNDGTIVATNPLTVSGPLLSVDTYTFPSPAVYTLTVSGSPKQGNDFQSFSLSYLVRVESNNQLSTQPFPLTLGIGFVMLCILLLLVAVKADGMME